MSFYYHLKLKDFLTSVDLQLLLYILAVAESLLYGLVIVTYAGALIAFRKADVSHSDEDFETTKLLEVEAMIQIFGIAIFFIVSIVLVGGVKEVRKMFGCVCVKWKWKFGTRKKRQILREEVKEKCENVH